MKIKLQSIDGLEKILNTEYDVSNLPLEIKTDITQMQAKCFYNKRGFNRQLDEFKELNKPRQRTYALRGVSEDMPLFIEQPDQ